MGLTENLYACIAGAITVYSGKVGIDRRYAPELLRGKAGEPNKGGAATAPAASPLAFESVAGKAPMIGLNPGSAERPKPVAIIRLTEHPGSPWWLLEKIPNGSSRSGGEARCVSSAHRVAPKENISTSKG